LKEICFPILWDETFECDIGESQSLFDEIMDSNMMM